MAQSIWTDQLAHCIITYWIWGFHHITWLHLLRDKWVKPKD
jgi:hypothetical protein